MLDDPCILDGSLTADYSKSRCYQALNSSCSSVGGTYNTSTNRCELIYNNNISQCNGSWEKVRKINNKWYIRISNWSNYQLYNGGLSTSSTTTYAKCWRNEGEFVKISKISQINSTTAKVTVYGYDRGSHRFTWNYNIVFDKINNTDCGILHTDKDRCYKNFSEF